MNWRDVVAVTVGCGDVPAVARVLDIDLAAQVLGDAPVQGGVGARETGRRTVFSIEAKIPV